MMLRRPRPRVADRRQVLTTGLAFFVLRTGACVQVRFYLQRLWKGADRSLPDDACGASGKFAQRAVVRARAGGLRAGRLALRVARLAFVTTGFSSAAPDTFA